MKMRRSDREVTDVDEKLGIVARCKVCRLGMIDETVGPGEPYIVPLNFGYEYVDGVLFLYLHGAGEGRKINILKNNCFFARRQPGLFRDGRGASAYSRPQGL